MPESREVCLIRPNWSAPANVKAFTTTRSGGFSHKPWDSFNLAEHCGDDPENVRQNRGLLQNLLPDRPHWLVQVHGSNVVNIQTNECSPRVADAVVSSSPGRVCAVLTADCLPVLLCNRAGTVVAAVHAGWRGLFAGVLEATVTRMGREAGELNAWLGPAIGPQAFEVGGDVFAAFTRLSDSNAIAFTAHGHRWHADLYELARLELLRLGVTRISGGQYCTYTQNEQFFSYRRDGLTGRMATVIWL